MRAAPVQKIEPVAVVQKRHAFHHAGIAKAERVAAQFLDLEAVAGTVEDDDIAALALALDVRLMRDAIDLETERDRKYRRQRSSAPPLSRMRIAGVEQQCSERYA